MQSLRYIKYKEKFNQLILYQKNRLKNFTGRFDVSNIIIKSKKG